MNNLIDEIISYLESGINFYSQAWLAASSDDARHIYRRVIARQRDMWRFSRTNKDRSQHCNEISNALAELRMTYDATLQRVLEGNAEALLSLITAERQYISFIRLQLTTEEGTTLEKTVSEFALSFLHLLKLLESEAARPVSRIDSDDLFEAANINAVIQHAEVAHESAGKHV